jgi:hypothetical protein
MIIRTRRRRRKKRKEERRKTKFNLNSTITFGEYDGYTVRHVVDVNPDYLLRLKEIGLFDKSVFRKIELRRKKEEKLKTNEQNKGIRSNTHLETNSGHPSREGEAR